MFYTIAIVAAMLGVWIWRSWVKYQERQALLAVIADKNKVIEDLMQQRKVLSELRELKRHGTKEEGNISFFSILRRVVTA